MDLILLYGPPASGKLTVGRELARMTGYALFHNHLVVDAVSAVFEFGSDPFVRLREELWLRVFQEAARANKSLIFTFAPERTVRPSFIPEAVRQVEALGGRVVFVELRCAEGALEQRMENASRQEFGKLSSVALYRDLRDRGALTYDGLPAPHAVIDTESATAEESARSILAQLDRRASVG